MLVNDEGEDKFNPKELFDGESSDEDKYYLQEY